MGLDLLSSFLATADPPPRKAAILLDNHAGIRRSCQPQPKAGQYLAQSAHDHGHQIRKDHPELELTIAWVPGHADIPGNELADEHAKIAAARESQPRARIPGHRTRRLPKSASAIKAAYNKQLEETWRARWRNSERGQRFARFDRTPPNKNYAKIYKEIARPQASLHVQLRSGHIGLNKYLHRIGAVDSPNCRACGVPESVDHFLLSCPRFIDQRAALRSSLAPAPLTRANVLAQKHIKAVTAFAISTHRFEHYTAR